MIHLQDGSLEPGLGIAVISRYRVLWSRGIGDLAHCYSVYGRGEPCPRCPLRSGAPSEGKVEVHHASGPRETLHYLPGLQLVVWPGAAAPLEGLGRGAGTAVYASEGIVEVWGELHSRRTGVESGRATGQQATRLLERLGSRRIRRQVEKALHGETSSGVLTEERLASVLFPGAEGRLHHLLLDLRDLELLEPVYLLRPCFRRGGSPVDPVSRLATVAESRGWSYDISPGATAENLSTWILPGVLDKLLADILGAAAELCPSLWLSCSTVESAEDFWPHALPGRYLALDFEIQRAPDRWHSENLRGLSQRMTTMGGWVKVEAEDSRLRVSIPEALPSPRASFGLLAFAGEELGFGQVLESAEEAGLRVRVAQSPRELAGDQSIADGLLLGAAGPMPGLPAALAARMPFQSILVAGGAVHSASGPEEPEYRIPLPAERSTLISALRRIASGSY